MDKFSIFLIREVLSYLDLSEILECSCLNKKFKKLINKPDFWNFLFKAEKTSSYHSGPFFDFNKASKLFRNLSLANSEFSSYEEMIKIYSFLQNPEKLEIVSISSSSPNFKDTSKNFIHYCNLFRVSVSSDLEDNESEILLELSEFCFIFSFSFKVFRLISNLSVLFAPKHVKVLIGETSDSFKWESETYEVDLSENYNTILVLPTLVTGKFLKIILSGHQSKHLESNLFQTTLQHIELTGHPTSFKGESIVSMIKSQQFFKILAKTELLSPFYYERALHCGLLKNFFDVLPEYNTDIEAYFYFKYFSSLELKTRSFSSFELVGNYFFDQGDLLAAEKIFFDIRDLRRMSRCELLKRKFEKLKLITKENDSRYPDKKFLLLEARKLGGLELEDELVIQLQF